MPQCAPRNCCCCEHQDNEVTVCLSEISTSCISWLDVGRRVRHTSCFVLLRCLICYRLWRLICCLWRLFEDTESTPSWKFSVLFCFVLHSEGKTSWRRRSTVVFLFVGVHQSNKGQQWRGREGNNIVHHYWFVFARCKGVLLLSSFDW